MKRWRARGLWVLLVMALAGAAVPLYRGLSLANDLRVARAAALSDEPETAAARLETMAARRPDQAEVAYLLGVAHRRSGAAAKAKDDLQRADQLGFSRKEILLQRQMIDFQAGKIEETGPHLQKRLAADCPDVLATQIYECLVKGYLSDVRVREAEMCLGYWLEWKPDAVPARVLRSDILFAAKDIKGLTMECEKILQIDPGHDKTRLRLAYLLLDNKDAGAALEHFERCLRRKPDDDDARLGMAACQRQLGEIAQAKSALEQVLARDVLDDDRRALALSELGQIALLEKSNQKAKECFEAALKLAPAKPTTHYSLALVLSRLGDKPAADEHLEISHRLETQATRLAEVIDEIFHDPGNAALRCEAGEILLDQGNLKEAFMWLLSVLRLERWHAPTHQALARYYTESGNKEMADRHLAWAAQAENNALTDAAAGR